MLCRSLWRINSYEMINWIVLFQGRKVSRRLRISKWPLSQAPERGKKEISSIFFDKICSKSVVLFFFFTFIMNFRVQCSFEYDWNVRRGRSTLVKVDTWSRSTSESAFWRFSKLWWFFFSFILTYWLLSMGWIRIECLKNIYHWTIIKTRFSFASRHLFRHCVFENPFLAISGVYWSFFNW